jgi:hypothetical protein
VGLRQRLASIAVRRVAVLVVEVPGWGRTRCTVEREIRRRGWRPALSPADADVLVVCGRPGARLAAAVELTWDQLPGPRARAGLHEPAEVSAALDRTVAALTDDGAQRADAAARPTEPAMGTGAEERPKAEERGTEHDGTDMPMPAGIPLARGGNARDGLHMDVLHLPLGPVLPAWPPGLVLHCTVQGDVVQDARAEVLPAATRGAPDGDLVPGSPADRCDRVARVLGLAGWADAAASAARLRDELLDGGDPAARRASLERLARRVRRSRTLRWAVPADVHGYLLGLLDDAVAAPSGAPTPVAFLPLDELAPLVTGRELGALRLLIAAAELAPGTLVRSGAGLS